MYTTAGQLGERFLHPKNSVIALQLESERNFVANVAVEMLNAACLTGNLTVPVNQWLSTECHVNVDQTNRSYTACQCNGLNRTTFAFSDIFVPPRPLNLKILFTKGCIRCGESVAIFSGILLGRAVNQIFLYHFDFLSKPHFNF